MKSVSRAALLAAITGSVIIVSFAYAAQAISGNMAFYIAAPLVTGFSLYYARTTIRAHTGRTPHYQHPVVNRSSIASLAEQQLSNKEMSSQAALYYIQMSVDPYRYAPRVSDHITATTRAYTLVRQLHIAIPLRLKDKPVAVPIDLVSRRGLLNEFNVTDDEGKRVETLTQAATIAHSFAAVETLVESLDSDVSEAYEKIRPLVQEFLCDPDHSNNTQALHQQIAREFQDIPNQTIATQRRLNTIVAFLNVLIGSYPLVIYVEPGKIGATVNELAGARGMRLTMRRRVLPAIGPGLSRFERMVEITRGWLGFRSAHVVWALSNATRSRSYHVECMGPEGTYLSYQRIVRADGIAMATSDVPECKLLGRYGQRFAHLYVSDFRPRFWDSSTKNSAELFYVAGFSERPPGELAPVAVSAWAAAVLASIAAAAKMGVEVYPSTDILSILLAVPASINAWLGFGPRSSGLFGGSMITRVLALLSFTLSLAVFGWFIFGSGVTTTTDSPAESFLAFMGFRDLPNASSEPWVERMQNHPDFRWWVTVVSLMYFVAMSASFSWFLRVKMYRHFLARTPRELPLIHKW